MKTATPVPGLTREAERTRTSSAQTSRTPRPTARRSRTRSISTGWPINFDVRKNIVFGTEVRSLVWDDESAVWHITTEGPEGEQSWRANAVIAAVGFLSRPNIPQIDGLETFRGRSFHTARWPSDLDITGKRVAVVGSGCTGYQLAAELAHEVGHLYLFQRTPSWVFDVPGYLAPYPPQINWLDRNFPYLTNFIRFTGSFMNNPAVSCGQPRHRPRLRRSPRRQRDQ